MSTIEEYKKVLEIELENIEQKDYELLVKVLRKWSNEYYINNAPSVSDSVYDEGYKKLKDIENKYPDIIVEDSPTQVVSYESDGDIKHQKPMLSISNVDDEKTNLNKIYEQGGEVVVEPKYDGIAISAVYEYGRLKHVATRGDGVSGKNITKHFLNSDQIPNQINSDEPYFEVRGEAIISLNNFEKLNEFAKKNNRPPFANTRNATGGILARKEALKELSDLITFMPYLVIGDQNDSHYDSLLNLENLGFTVSPLVKKFSHSQEANDYLKYIEDNREIIPYDIDGAVIKLDSELRQKSMGHTAKAPRYMVAQKFPPVEVMSRVLDVTFQVGRTGRITPVAEIEPVLVQGSKISRVTLHNIDEIERLGLSINDYVSVVKGGDVIPKITRVNDVGVPKNKKIKIIALSNCPVCNSVVKEDGALSFCTGTSVCKAQVKGQLKNFISKSAMNIDGLGERIVEDLLERKIIRTAPDIYKLTREDFLKLDRQGDKSISNALESIEKSKNVELHKFINALGVHGVGVNMSKTLAKKFGNLEKIMNADREELLGIEGVGEVIVENILTYFNQTKTREVVENLLSSGIQIKNPEMSVDNSLEGKTIVITGSFEGVSRDIIKEELENMGAKVSGSISKKTDLLLAGEKAGSKLDKASKLGVGVLEVSSFNKNEVIGFFDEKIKRKPSI